MAVPAPAVGGGRRRISPALLILILLATISLLQTLTVPPRKKTSAASAASAFVVVALSPTATLITARTTPSPGRRRRGSGGGLAGFGFRSSSWSSSAQRPPTYSQRQKQTPPRADTNNNNNNNGRSRLYYAPTPDGAVSDLLVQQKKDLDAAAAAAAVAVAVAAAEEADSDYSKEVGTTPAAVEEAVDDVVAEAKAKTKAEAEAATPTAVATDSTTTTTITVATTTKSPSPSPSITKTAREVASLGLPALGGMLIDPLMSLVDTAAVGQVSSLELAALAPCSSICQFVFFASFFLSAATTNLVAANSSEGEGVAEGLDRKEVQGRMDRNERVVSTASILALSLGTVVSAVLWVWSDPLLKLAGLSGSAPEMLPIARRYLRIRSLGLPPVLLATVLQGASLGRGDAKTPLKIFAAAGVVNLVGDVYLTLFRGWGSMGAAVATVAAQVGAAGYYAFKCLRLPSSSDVGTKGSGAEEGEEESSGGVINDAARASKEWERPSSRGVALRWRGPPERSVLKTFGTVASTLLFRSVFNMLTFSLLTRTAAQMGSQSLAAHQVTLQLWWMLSWFPEPMVVAAQALVSRYDANSNSIDDDDERSSNNKERVSHLVKVLFGMSAGIGLVVATLTGLALVSPTVAGAFVADREVQRLLVTTAPWAVLAQCICPLTTVSDGICVGLGDLRHMPVAMVGGTLAAAMGLREVLRRGLPVSAVWVCMNVFFAVRIVLQLTLSRRLKGFVGEWLAAGRRRLLFPSSSP